MVEDAEDVERKAYKTKLKAMHFTMVGLKF